MSARKLLTKNFYVNSRFYQNNSHCHLAFTNLFNLCTLENSIWFILCKFFSCVYKRVICAIAWVCLIQIIFVDIFLIESFVISNNFLMKFFGIAQSAET